MDHRVGTGIKLATHYGQRAAKIKVPHPRRGNIQPAMVVMQQGTVIGSQPVRKLVEPL